jgi:hypothetical protein
VLLHNTSVIQIPSDVGQCTQLYEVWQKSNATDFLLTMNFIPFTNQGYPPQNSFLGQLHSDGSVVSIASAGILFSSSVTLFWISPKVPKRRPFKWVLSRGNKKKSQRLRSGE